MRQKSKGEKRVVLERPADSNFEAKIRGLNLDVPDRMYERVDPDPRCKT